MALKTKLTAFEYAALNDVLKAEYKIQSDGNYTIDLGGAFVTDKDPSALMNALELERNEHKATKSKFDSVVAERDAAKKQAELAALQKTGDAEQLKQFFEKQMAEVKATFEAQQAAEKQKIELQQKAMAEQFRKNKATELATELFGSKAPLFVPALLEKMTVKTGEFGQEPVLEFVGDNGVPLLGATKESFKQTLLTNPLYKDMIVVSHASGGSANEGKDIPGTRNSDGSPRKFKDYSSGELMRLKKNSPEEFRKLLASANA